MPQDKTGLLKAFLGSLPGTMAARLAMAVEVDQLMDNHNLPHNDILEGLRPVLRRENYERTPTPLRILSDEVARSNLGCRRPFSTSIGPDWVAKSTFVRSFR